MVLTFTEDIALEILKTLAVIFPSYFVFRGVVRKSSKTNIGEFKQIQKKMDEGFQKNSKDHQQIFNVIRCMDDEKIAINQIRHAISDANEYILSEKVRKILDIFSDAMVGFTKDILEIGLNNLTYTQILLKYSNLRDTILNEASFQFNGNHELLEKFYSKIEPLRNNYLKEIDGIFNDGVNNVNSRFSTETLRYVQKIANETVKFLQDKDNIEKLDVE